MHTHMNTHSHRDLWGPYVQLWTVCEPQLERGDTERERWMACSVVFCLPSVRDLPSVKGETTPVSARFVCHIERFFNQPLCKLYNTLRHSCRFSPLTQWCTILFFSCLKKGYWRVCLYSGWIENQLRKWKSEIWSHMLPSLTHPTALRL